MPPYYGMVTWIDDNLGRLLDTLRERGVPKIQAATNAAIGRRWIQIMVDQIFIH